MSAVITDLPDPNDPATFDTKANAAWQQLASASEDWNLLSVNLDAAVAAVSAGLGSSLWTAGTYAIGTLKFSVVDGLLYRRLIATASASDPTVDTTNWALQTTSAPVLVVVSGTTQTGVKNAHYEMTNAAASTFTLPASPAVGDWVWVGFANGRIDNVLARNGKNIMGLAQDMTVNWPYAGLILRYISAGFGWRVFK